MAWVEVDSGAWVKEFNWRAIMPAMQENHSQSGKVVRVRQAEVNLYAAWILSINELSFCHRLRQTQPARKSATS